MSFTKVAPAGIGTSPGNSILIGDSLLHSTGIDIGSSTGVGVTIRQHGDATFTGIITASAFFGDGSGLEGVSSSGIGTPLSDDDTSDLNKIYYVNQELSIGSTITVNHPSSAVASYTHYQDLVVTDDADFIVSDGDTFIPDVLGIRTSTSTASAATGGRIRAGTITNAGANGAPNFPNGLTGTAGTFTGAITAASGTITGNLGVAGVLTYEDVTNIDSVGVITARSGIRIGATGANSLIDGNATGISLGTGTARQKLHIHASDSGAANMVFTNATTGNSAGDGFIVGITGGEVAQLNMQESADLKFSTADTERLRIGSAGQLGIAGANYGTSGQVLTSQGASSAPTWATVSTPVKEQFLLSCDGSSVSTSNGTYTTTNVTAVQTLSGNNTTTLTGSEISYQPPTGTTCVIYEFITSSAAGDNDGIYNFCLYIDGTQIVYSGLSARVSSNGSHPVHFKWAINIGGSADNNTGRQASWSSAKTLLLRARDYDSNHDQIAHQRNHFQMGGGNFRQPQIGITAIG